MSKQFRKDRFASISPLPQSGDRRKHTVIGCISRFGVADFRATTMLRGCGNVSMHPIHRFLRG
jgi:hypothetical protein